MAILAARKKAELASGSIKLPDSQLIPDKIKTAFEC
jgi:hypothetical protein